LTQSVRETLLHVSDAFDLRLVGEAHLAAGHVGLLGLPLLLVALVRDGADVGDRLGAAQGRDRLLTSCCSFEGPVAQDSRANTENNASRRFMISSSGDGMTA